MPMHIIAVCLKNNKKTKRYLGRYDSYFVVREHANLWFKNMELTLADLKIYEMKLKKEEKNTHKINLGIAGFWCRIN